MFSSFCTYCFEIAKVCVFLTQAKCELEDQEFVVVLQVKDSIDPTASSNDLIELLDPEIVAEKWYQKLYKKRILITRCFFTSDFSSIQNAVIIRVTYLTY
jgi:hypothetical protein